MKLTTYTKYLTELLRLTMKINVIATGSSGNLYEILDNTGNSMLIEAGVPRSEYMKHKEGVKAPEMCVISHNHSDHSKCAGEFEAIIPVYKWQEESISQNFKAAGFKLKHGEGFSMAFIIKFLADNDYLFFGTDFEFSEHYDELYETLKHYKVNKFLIECNYNVFLFHKADEIQRVGCIRHLSDAGVVRFIRMISPENPKIITIHGSNRLSGDTYTKKYISSKLLTSKVSVAVGASGKTKNLFTF